MEQENAPFLRMVLGSMRKAFNVANNLFSTDIGLWKCSNSKEKLFIWQLRIFKGVSVSP